MFLSLSILGVQVRTKIKGAVEHCKKKKLTKSCLYEKKTKYLVLVSDTVTSLEVRKVNVIYNLS